MKTKGRIAMLCPCCKKELKEGEQMRLETLNEHVCNPNDRVALKPSFHCASEFCAAHITKIIWNENGERYGYVNGIKWIDDNDGPFGSFQRGCNVEIHKQDENKHLFTFPCWPLKGWKCRSKWEYTSNDDGDILSKKRYFEWVTSGGVIHMWGIRMLAYSLKEIHRNALKLDADKTDKYALKELRRMVHMATWPRAEWWSAFMARRAIKIRGLTMEQR